MGVASDDNAWWMDVLENGPGSPYASFFDIDWMPLKPDLAYKVLLPILGDQFGKVLEEQQLVLSFEEGAFWLHYFSRRLPIEPHSWAMILNQRIEELAARLGNENPHLLEYQSVLTAISHLPARNETDPEKVSERRREKEVIKRRLAELATASPEVNTFLQENVAIFNGIQGEPRSFDLLDQLLQDQPYRLAYWRVAADEINYRRFFDVNELAALCMERLDVFQKTHGLILRLLAEGKVTGLRIDHPDGLYDPAQYLWRLQRARFLQLCRAEFESRNPSPDSPAAHGEPTDAAQAATWDELEAELGRRFDALSQGEKQEPFSQSLYVVVEKILEPGERLPENWPVDGTTGYDFLNVLNGIFIDRTQAKNVRRLVRAVPPATPRFQGTGLSLQEADHAVLDVRGNQRPGAPPRSDFRTQSPQPRLHAQQPHRSAPRGDRLLSGLSHVRHAGRSERPRPPLYRIGRRPAPNGGTRRPAPRSSTSSATSYSCPTPIAPTRRARPNSSISSAASSR